MWNQNNDIYPSRKTTLWIVFLLALSAAAIALIFAYLLFYTVDAVSGQENESGYPLRQTGYTIPDNPYRTARGEGYVWPTHEQQMTLEQQLDFSLVEGYPIPLEVAEYLANNRARYVWFSEFIYWTNAKAFTTTPAIQVFSNRLFSDYYMIAVYDSFALGNDGNPHPRGFWWVKIEDFRRVFPEVE